MAKKFPYRKKDDTALEEGKQVARARYNQDLRESANDILKEVVEDGVLDEDELYERTSERADSAVIYTRDALDIMELSDNWLAFDEEGGELEPGTDITTAVTQWAYYAYREDLNRMIEAFRDEYED